MGLAIILWFLNAHSIQKLLSYIIIMNYNISELTRQSPTRTDLAQCSNLCEILTDHEMEEELQAYNVYDQDRCEITTALTITHGCVCV